MSDSDDDAYSDIQNSIKNLKEQNVQNEVPANRSVLLNFKKNSVNRLLREIDFIKQVKNHHTKSHIT
jgi:allophanate hydrolase subunit 1